MTLQQMLLLLPEVVLGRAPDGPPLSCRPLPRPPQPPPVTAQPQARPLRALASPPPLPPRSPNLRG
jgi:hypothetical protein